MVNLKQLADIERDLQGLADKKRSFEKPESEEAAAARLSAAAELKEQIEVLRTAKEELKNAAPAFAKRIGLLLEQAEQELAKLVHASQTVKSQAFDKQKAGSVPAKG